MAVTLKSRQEIAQLREAGRIVAETYEILRPYVKPGTSTAELDQIAEDYIRGKGAKPIYKGYGARPARHGFPAIPAFPATICVAVNDVICHGIPSPKEILREGDIIGVDIGVLYKGWVGDSWMLRDALWNLVSSKPDQISNLVILEPQFKHMLNHMAFRLYENMSATAL